MDIDINTLRNYIKILTDNYRLKFSEAGELSKVIDIITEENERGNPNLIPVILKEYRPSELFPDTIGSFLFGCLQQTYGDVPVECSPLCAIGIKDDNEIKIKKCQNQIYVQYSDAVDSRFSKLNDSQSRQAYLFVHVNFMGLTQKEKTFLKNNGVYKLHILLTHNSKHHTIVKMKDIDDIPIIEEYDGINYAISENYTNKDDADNNFNDEENDNIYIYIILSVAVIIIIAAAYSRN